ncbi:MAG: flavin reductase family protein [Eubacteriales bacterium]|nr:flavin reductase family protein [Eubacteriales bacterium]
MCVQPAFIMGTYDEQGNANFAPTTWVSVTWETDHYLVVISMFGTKQTKTNVERSRMLSVNLVGTDMLRLMDYFGSRSGFRCGKNGVPYRYSDGNVLKVPTLDLSKWVYECEVSKEVETGDSKTYFCTIRDVQVEQTIDISDGIDLTAFNPVIYSGHYHSIGEHLGKIGDFYKES